MLHGIDISHWNGNINFAKLNLDFVIMKLSEKLHQDVNFETYYNACKIPMGAYIYVHTKTTDEARKEAEYAVSCLRGRKLPVGIWLDLEDSSLLVLGKKKIMEIINAEADILRKAGYNVGIYTNKSWYNSVLDSASLVKEFPIWYARYPASDNGTVKESLNPLGNVDGVKIWQYSSKGRIDGIQGNVDLNLSYCDSIMDFFRIDKPVAPKQATPTRPTVKYGSRGIDVKYLQTKLVDNGYQLAIDGIFGNNTKSAVLSYQKAHGLVVDGIVGVKTWASLDGIK